MSANPPQHKLIVLSAPSGAGKSTLAQMLIAKYPKHFCLSISHTTRLPRPGEQEGKHYFFILEQQFLQMVSRQEFLEYALVFGQYYYGTSKAFVKDAFKSGKSVVFDIDVQGAQNLKKQFLEHCVTIFIFPPSLEELEARLRNRNSDHHDSIKIRMQTAELEMKSSCFFDYSVTNHELQKTFEEIEEILRKEGCI